MVNEVSDEACSDEIAAALAGLYPVWDPSFVAEYLGATFDVVPRPSQRFESLLIAQAAEGDVARGMGGIIRLWWLANNTGCNRVCQVRKEWFAEDGPLFVVPGLKFFTDGTDLIMTERFGSNLIAGCRLNTLRSGQRIEIGGRTAIWTSR